MRATSGTCRRTVSPLSRWWWVAAVAALACAHGPKRGDLATLKPIAEDFHLRARWKDYRGAAVHITPDRREDFLKARHRRADERDLSISDYEVEGAELAPDGQSAVVVSRMSWVRLPSMTEQQDIVRSRFEYREGRWWLTEQDAGPFLPELSPHKKTPAVSGPAETTGVGNPPMGPPTN